MHQLRNNNKRRLSCATGTQSQSKGKMELTNGYELVENTRTSLLGISTNRCEFRKEDTKRDGHKKGTGR
jgi:hypothetical protein